MCATDVCLAALAVVAAAGVSSVHGTAGRAAIFFPQGRLSLSLFSLFSILISCSFIFSFITTRPLFLIHYSVFTTGTPLMKTAFRLWLKTRQSDRICTPSRPSSKCTFANCPTRSARISCTISLSTPYKGPTT